MNIIRGFYNLPRFDKKTVLTIGNFDGVHLGHQQLIRQVIACSLQDDLQSIVMTFEPQPNEFFSGNEPQPRLMRFCEKYRALNHYALDYLLALHFNKAFAAIDAEQFVTDIILNKLNAQTVIVGDDFRFGARRAGDFALLQQLASKHNFHVAQMPTALYEDERISSTKVRAALASGNLALVQNLLGRPYTLWGKVAHGDKRGRTLGFPTANIYLHRQHVAVSGVFAVRAHGIDAQPYNGVANVGTRPTFDGTRVLLEVNLFDFNRDIYGVDVEIEFCHKLRDEKRYDDFSELVAQIHRDVENAKQWFSAH